ncbi:MAG: FKBP-type peptidyl-prolyl cis-trans isomerase [Muribaculaceae bacterium]|nr:FKBP-type peptidyl-prolyl cis-trans isomerase [Muribaculaceae bacterium]MDE6537220.1 FKBP-type peptidyl-prolyl cis-trans isomerase [Muribaculaceae bacterium]
MKKQILTLGVALLCVGGLMSCKSDKAKAADSAVAVTEETEKVEAPLLTDQQIAVSDSVFNAYKGKNSVASDSVVTTSTGLRYMVVKEGEGKAPGATDIVKVHYIGTLPNGEVFDSSVERGEPISFPLNQVISGWTEGLQLMKEGGKTVFYIPSNLAYGPRAVSDQIGPNQDLVFEVELIQVNPEQ